MTIEQIQKQDLGRLHIERIESMGYDFYFSYYDFDDQILIELPLCTFYYAIKQSRAYLVSLSPKEMNEFLHSLCVKMICAFLDDLKTRFYGAA